MEHGYVIFLLTISMASSQRMFDALTLRTTTPLYSPGESILGIPAGLPETPDNDADDASPNVECTPQPRGRATCACSPGYVGRPPVCRPGPELWSACFHGNPCGPDSECELDADGTSRLCACAHGFVGCPPNCRPGPKYLSRCAKCGLNSECDYRGGTATCYCLPGYVGQYDRQGRLPNCTASGEMASRCGPYAECRRGACACACLPGYEGKPPQCKPGPELWRVCFNDRPCGPYSLCTMHDGAPKCAPCSAGYAGKPPNCYKP